MRYIFEKAELKMAEFYMDDAAEEAKKSLCKKSQRGAVLVSAKGKVIGKGHNLVTNREFCEPCVREDIHNNTRVELCSAIHAEQLAVLDAHGKRTPLKGCRMYQAELKDGDVRYSGDPSCTVCSRLLYAAGIELVLRHMDGIAVYEPEELNNLSLEYVLKNR